MPGRADGKLRVADVNPNTAGVAAIAAALGLAVKPLAELATASDVRTILMLGNILPGLTPARVAELLEMGGLSDKSDVRAGALSHGDQRAAEIMMSLALKPRLLMLDEPTAGMGDQETYEITQLIRRLHKDRKLTIVLIEHDMRVVFHLAERIMVLDQGKFLAEGTPQEIAANKAVQTAYLGQAA